MGKIMLMPLFHADENQLRAKGYDKTPDIILEVPIGESVYLLLVFIHLLISINLKTSISVSSQWRVSGLL